MKFLTHDGLLYFWKKVKSYVDTSLTTAKTYTNSSISNITKVTNADKLVVTNLGSFSGKTVADLQTAINNWYANYSSKSGKAYFQGDWASVWNSGDLTKTINDGITYTIDIVGTYSNSSYAQFMITSYGDKVVYFVRKSSTGWGLAYTPWNADNVNGYKISVLSQASYDALTTKNSSTIYYII